MTYVILLIMKDEQLMKLYKEGDIGAFERLYEKFAPMVFGYLKKRLPQSEVEDAYQNVWRHLHEKREHYVDQPFGPWFFHVIKNLLIDHYRSRGRYSDFLKVLEGTETLSKHNEKVNLEPLLAHLSVDSRDLVQKYYLDGITYEELETETGMSQITLRKRLSRAISQLRKRSEE